MIDLRSDFCAPPTEEMWEAMRAAPFGWAAAGEDETVNELERRAAALLGKDAAVFVATCSLANLVAVLAQTERGERVAIDETAHILVNEGDWLTQLAGLVPVPLGEAASLVCLENTRTRPGGTVLPPAEAASLTAGAAHVHLDGARLANAAVALGVPLAELAACADTVAFSLNKGLCAPFGAVLAGEERTIARARIELKRLGGATIHKAGMLAAAGLVALDLIGRLADDHRRARELAGLLGLPAPETNIVMTDLGAGALPLLEARGVLALAPSGDRVRLVTHRGIADRSIAEAVAAIDGL
ncbi:MAG TPA: beta-eliminating lyase-related protein [Gaiellaceae bacterium]|nr:beta-eliminating lyase-related protein [Gaiellaceae bacterium]